MRNRNRRTGSLLRSIGGLALLALGASRLLGMARRWRTGT